MTAIRIDEIDTLETPQALDELDDDSEQFTGTVEGANYTTHYDGRMRKRHIEKERELEVPEEWVGVFKRDGGLY